MKSVNILIGIEPIYHFLYKIHFRKCLDFVYKSNIFAFDVKQRKDYVQ